jgi:hypothetical protein
MASVRETTAGIIHIDSIVRALYMAANGLANEYSAQYPTIEKDEETLLDIRQRFLEAGSAYRNGKPEDAAKKFLVVAQSYWLSFERHSEFAGFVNALISAASAINGKQGQLFYDNCLRLAYQELSQALPVYLRQLPQI